jgi:hypothetical protein
MRDKMAFSKIPLLFSDISSINSQLKLIIWVAEAGRRSNDLRSLVTLGLT